MFSTALADVTETHRWLDCARERGWGLKTGTCKVRNITSRDETTTKTKTRCKATFTSNLESGVGVTELIRPAGGCCCWTDKLSIFQSFYFNALMCINVIFFANSISLLYIYSRSRPVCWLILPPAVWGKYLQPFKIKRIRLFVGSCVISHSFTTEKYNKLNLWFAT